MASQKASSLTLKLPEMLHVARNDPQAAHLVYLIDFVTLQLQTAVNEAKDFNDLKRRIDIIHNSLAQTPECH
ncbi:hypothetical protein [Motiliproteus coralliicola]|uniref:hypothetical protein n=1 Tax=Motiliproteus coralliicola TaxID=2283196 RepID=UPI0010588410|nr:hypothetical protein [Motiliproteus coralliicola]